MKRLKWFWVLFLIFSGIGIVIVAALAFDKAKGKAVIKGIRQLRQGQTEAVSLSSPATRMLTKNNLKAEHAFRQRMRQEGWEFVCYYGRSALYRNGQQEVLARKTPLVGGFCIYELMDETYFKHMKPEAHEVA